MDRITQSLLREFQKQHSLESFPESSAFERFSNYIVVSSLHQEVFDTADVSLDDNTVGIDGVAILVNGALVTTSDEVEDLVEANNYLEATFIFIQAKTGGGFDSSAIGGMEFAVVDFFQETPQLPQSDFMKEALKVTKAIFDRSSKFSRGKPTCKLYYVSPGTWVDDPVLTIRVNAVNQSLSNLNLFKEITFTPVDADKIQKLYGETKNAISREFTFTQRTVIPEIEGVKESYLGLLPAKEFIKLIEDGNGDIIKSLFYDNVRDWQEYNPVNSEIKDTLSTPEGRRRFALMNNGVTIIAKTLRPTANRFLIEDYQIVNGCQTSHVLHDQKQYLDDSIYVPLRVISTQNDDITRAIITATNRQTAVEKEQFLALSDFQKKLEAYFNTFEPKNQIFYERRSRQYGHLTSVEKVRIFSMKMLLRAYASIVLQEPHRTTRSYNTLLENVGKNIFAKTDKLEPYYTSAYAFYKIEFLFRNETLPSIYKPARYHILMAFARLAAKKQLPKASSNDMGRTCEAINQTLWNDATAIAVFKQAIALIDEITGGTLDRDDIRSQPFTEKLKAKLTAKGV